MSKRQMWKWAKIALAGLVGINIVLLVFRKTRLRVGSFEVGRPSY